MYSRDTRRLEFYIWARWTTMSRRVFYILPFEDAIPCASPQVFLDNPASSFGFYTTTTHSGLRLFLTLKLRWRFLPQEVGFGLPLLDDLTSTRTLGVLQSCFARSDLIGVHRWNLPVSSTMSSWFSPVLRWPPRLYTYLIILHRMVPSLVSIVSAYVWFRFVD